MKPILNIMTIVKNSELTIERAIRNLIKQNFDQMNYVLNNTNSYSEFEYIFTMCIYKKR